ncbi:MAG: DNA gyrase subunit B, partial [Oscillospiraceae bacterium]|nr:DNA gyrase subunit B [Oscillospiraceae bacterium]
KVSGGLHGVGASVVNALSEWLEVEVCKEGTRYSMKFSRGDITEGIKELGKTDKSGTCVRFKPDAEVFDDTVYDYEILHTRMREQAFLNAGLTITIKDEREGMEQGEELCYEGGIREYVGYLNRHKAVLHEDVIYLSGAKDDAVAEIALQYNDGYNETLVSFANDIHTPDGGMHETGFKTALTRVINAYGAKANIIKGDDKVSGDDVREGIAAVISVKLPEAQFEGQTKQKLGNAYIRTLVDSIVNDQLMEYFDEHPATAKIILEKAMMANRAREAARRAKESVRRKTGLESGQMPDKLQDCNERDPSLCEIYIVEGDSAAGSAIQGRDSRFQAILAMWGKMLNVEKARADKIYGNDKLYPLILALGAGIGDEFNIEKLRYHKIIIMADADVDGSHIRTLLLTFFFRYMRPLIENGYVYSAVPPLYKLTRGKQQRVAYSDEQRDKISAEMRADNPNVKLDISRFKGLGEMDPHELWETTMNPETRSLRRITLNDAIQADQIFTVLMGEEVEPRREWIEQNAKYVVNLDI